MDEEKTLENELDNENAKVSELEKEIERLKKEIEVISKERDEANDTILTMQNSGSNSEDTKSDFDEQFGGIV